MLMRPEKLLEGGVVVGERDGELGLREVAGEALGERGRDVDRFLDDVGKLRGVSRRQD